MGYKTELEEASACIKKGHILFFCSGELGEDLHDLHHMEDLYVYTAGLHELGHPEIVFLLGPSGMDQSIPANAVSGIVFDAMTRLNKTELITMATQAISCVSVGGETRARFYKRVYFNRQDSDDKHRYLTIKEKHLKKLHELYKSDQFDYVLFEPMLWVN